MTGLLTLIPFVFFVLSEFSNNRLDGFRFRAFFFVSHEPSDYPIFFSIEVDLGLNHFFTFSYLY